MPIEYDTSNLKLLDVILKKTVDRISRIEHFEAYDGSKYFVVLVNNPLTDVIYPCDFISEDHYIQIYTIKNCNFVEVSKNVLPQIYKLKADDNFCYNVQIYKHFITFRSYKNTGWYNSVLTKEYILKFNKRTKKFYIDKIYSPKNIQGLYAYASYRKLKKEELENMQSDRLREMRNEIYARHGYPFYISEKYFDLNFLYYDWYKKIPKKTPEEACNELSDIEKYNVQLILNVEKTKK